MKRIVVFGGSGFLGTALIKRLSYGGNDINIIAVARNEGALVALKERFPFIEIQVGDISDKWVVKKAMKDADEVYLLSAMKHVGLSEVDVKSCITSNIIGCMNVVDESLITKPKVLMFVSTDKAGNPSGVYGCSKRIGEKLIAEAEKINPETQYRVVRYGNVLYSTGSVLCKWKERMQEGKGVIVTDVEATRYFWSIDQALDLIFTCLDVATDSTPFAPSMKSIRIGDLLEAMMSKYGQVPIELIGLQDGENLHECITNNGVTSYQSERHTKEEILKFI